MENLATRCAQTHFEIISTLKNPKVWSTRDGPLAYVDNGARILGVAHMDTVLQEEYCFKDNRGKVYSPRLDDRLGVHILLDLLPMFGLKYDVLLTDSEERCMSTAEYFRTDKEYLWASSFDRAGTDVVMYQHETPEAIDAVRSVGLKVGMGTYSDIASLSIGCGGFNFGTGYYAQHSYACYADLRETAYMIGRFRQFYELYKDTWFDEGSWYNDYRYADESQHNYHYWCDECYGDWYADEAYWIDDTPICPTCGLPLISMEEASKIYYGYQDNITGDRWSEDYVRVYPGGQ